MGSSHQRRSLKKGVLENTCARVSFSTKLLGEARNFIKRDTLAQVFSWEFWEIFKNTYFEEHQQAAASVVPSLLTLTTFSKTFSAVSKLHFFILLKYNTISNLANIESQHDDPRMVVKICSKLAELNFVQNSYVKSKWLLTTKNPPVVKTILLHFFSHISERSYYITEEMLYLLSFLVVCYLLQKWAHFFTVHSYYVHTYVIYADLLGFIGCISTR